MMPHTKKETRAMHRCIETGLARARSLISTNAVVVTREQHAAPVVEVARSCVQR